MRLSPERKGDQFLWMGFFQVVGLPSFLASSAVFGGEEAWYPFLRTASSSSEGLAGRLLAQLTLWDRPPGSGFCLELVGLKWVLWSPGHRKGIDSLSSPALLFLSTPVAGGRGDGHPAAVFPGPFLDLRFCLMFGSDSRHCLGAAV